jgi:hypothetical protein
MPLSGFPAKMNFVLSYSILELTQNVGITLYRLGLGAKAIWAV